MDQEGSEVGKSVVAATLLMRRGYTLTIDPAELAVCEKTSNLVVPETKPAPDMLSDSSGPAVRSISAIAGPEELTLRTGGS
jgi:hypothetical protein